MFKFKNISLAFYEIKSIIQKILVGQLKMFLEVFMQKHNNILPIFSIFIMSFVSWKKINQLIKNLLKKHFQQLIFV